MNFSCAIKQCASISDDFRMSSHVLFSYSDILDLNQDIVSSLQSNMYSTVHHCPLVLSSTIYLHIVNYLNAKSCPELTLLRLNCSESTSSADISLTLASLCRWLEEMHVTRVSIISSCALAQARDDTIYTSLALESIPALVAEFPSIERLDPHWPLHDLVLGQLLHFLSYTLVEHQVFLLRGYTRQVASASTTSLWTRLIETWCPGFELLESQSTPGPETRDGQLRPVSVYQTYHHAARRPSWGAVDYPLMYN